MCLEMYQRQTTFWAWSVDDWFALLGPNITVFSERYQRKDLKHPARAYLPLIAYLLKGVSDAWRLLEQGEMYPLAQKCFEKSLIDSEVARVRMVLQSWGYQQKEQGSFVACVSYVFLRNGSPHLEDLTSTVLAQVAQTCVLPCVQHYLPQMARALCELGMIEHALPAAHAQRAMPSGTDGSVSAEWLSGANGGASRPRSESLEHLLLSSQSRPLASGLSSRSHLSCGLTYELALELVAAVNHMNVGEWSSQRHRSHIPHERMAALRATRKESYPSVDAGLFARLPGMAVDSGSTNADRALRTPRSMRSLAGPSPRIIDKEAWAKVLWAAMNLKRKSPKATRTAEVSGGVGACGRRRCFAALRSDEIVRLRVGCVRWQYEEVMIDKLGRCYRKTRRAFWIFRSTRPRRPTPNPFIRWLANASTSGNSSDPKSGPKRSMAKPASR